MTEKKTKNDMYRFLDPMSHMSVCDKLNVNSIFCDVTQGM